jgi:hypothetical protein
VVDGSWDKGKRLYMGCGLVDWNGQAPATVSPPYKLCVKTARTTIKDNTVTGYSMVLAALAGAAVSRLCISLARMAGA